MNFLKIEKICRQDLFDHFYKYIQNLLDTKKKHCNRFIVYSTGCHWSMDNSLYCSSTERCMPDYMM